MKNQPESPPNTAPTSFTCGYCGADVSLHHDNFVGSAPPNGGCNRKGDMYYTCPNCQHTDTAVGRSTEPIYT